MTLLAYQVSTDGQNWCARWEHVPDPILQQGTVVIEVKAAALAWSDVLLTADVALVTVGRLTPQCTVVVHAGAG